MMSVTEILLKEDFSSHEKRSFPMHYFISVLGRGSHRVSKISNFHYFHHFVRQDLIFIQINVRFSSAIYAFFTISCFLI